MTTNAFIFSWDMYGIESIIPITEYEHFDHTNLLLMLAGEPTKRNPINSIVQSLIMRAKYNQQRRYEIYAIDCTEELDDEFWKQQWQDEPQATAELIRQRGLKIYSDRLTEKPPVIT